jgi:hypothetical protein
VLRRGWLRGGRWLLPWLCVTLVSASLGYATNAAVTSSWQAMDGRSERSRAPLPASLDDPRKMVVTIWFWDRATGQATSMGCVTDQDLVESDVWVDADDVLHVFAALCPWS